MKSARKRAARQRRRERRRRLLRRLGSRRGCLRRRIRIGRWRRGALARDLLRLGRGRRSRRLFGRLGFAIDLGGRGSLLRRSGLLALALLRCLLGRRGRWRGRLLRDRRNVLLLLGALVEILRHALLEAGDAIGEDGLALARQLLLGVEPVEQIGRIEVAAETAGAARKRARNRDQDGSCDQTLR